MWILVKDLLARNSVFLIIAAAVMTIFPCIEVEGVVVAVFWMLLGFGMMLGEQSAGAGRLTNTLPVSRKIRSRVIWLQAVIVFPVLYAFVSYPILIFFALFDHVDSHTFVVQLAAPLLGMGASAAAFLLIPWLWPTPGVLREQVRAFVVLGAYYLFLAVYGVTLFFTKSGMEWIYALLLRREGEFAVPPGPVYLGISVFVAIVAAALAFRFAQRIIESMPLYPKRAATAPPTQIKVLPYRPMGLLGPWSVIAFQAGVLTLNIVAALTLFARLSIRFDIEAEEVQSASFAIVLMTSCAPALLLLSQCAVWAGAMRSLRMLPITRIQLTGLLLSFYLVCLAIVIASVFLLANLLGMESPAQTTISYATCFLAWGFLCFVLLAHFGGLGAFVLLLILWSIATLCLNTVVRNPDWFIVVQPLLLLISLASAALLYRTIGHSSAAYRRKPLIDQGRFGQP